MPTRNPSGAVTSSTVTITEPFQIGSQSASQRISTGSPMPMPKKIGVTQRTRSQPGAVSRRKPVGGGGAAWSCVRVRLVTSVTLLGLPGEILDELRRAWRAGSACRSSAASRPDSPARCRRPASRSTRWMNCVERAAVRLSPPPASGCRGRGRPCRSRSAGVNVWQPPQPFCWKTASPGGPAAGLPPLFTHASNFAAVEDVDVAAHHGVAEAAELGADDRERAESRRRDDERVVLPRHGVLLLRELGHPERVDDVLRRDVELRVPALRAASGSRTSCRSGT